MKNKLLTVALCLFTVLLVLTGSIALPIYIRPFYYWQVDSLGVPELTGYDKQTVIDAYDEVLDYLTIPGREFGTGAMPYSESGASHFADCKVLFNLNAIVLLVSVAGVILLAFLRKTGRFHPHHPFGVHPAALCGGGMLLVFAVAGGLAALNFDAAFTLFHKVLFAGKTNWVMNPRTDPIVEALPSTFFVNCGILILSSVVIISIGLLIYGIRHRRKS